MNALRTATTEPPPPSGEFVSKAELERQLREYEDGASKLEREASQKRTRAASIKEYIERVWGES